jgi:hypothetical protein
MRMFHQELSAPRRNRRLVVLSSVLHGTQESSSALAVHADIGRVERKRKKKEVDKSDQP